MMHDYIIFFFDYDCTVHNLHHILIHINPVKKINAKLNQLRMRQEVEHVCGFVINH
jgi:hypothetical protein